MRGLVFITSVTAALAAVSCAHAQDTQGASSSSSAAPAFTLSRPREPEEGQPAVINAEPASPRDWPSTFVFNGLDECTATAVGPRAILTAAHCVANNATGLLPWAAPNGIEITCTHHPLYPAEAADFALCVAARDLPSTGYERVSADLSLLRQGTKVTLVGFGCTDPSPFGLTFGTLFSGPTFIQSGPREGNVSVTTQGGAALCPGDSGGAAYVNSEGRRVIIGVNSRWSPALVSTLASTPTATFVDWALGWTRQKGVGICGIGSEPVDGCRG